jgi:hypothetical protein
LRFLEETYLPPVTMATFPWRSGMSVKGLHAVENISKITPVEIKVDISRDVINWIP